MDNNENNEQNETSQLALSLQLDLLSTFLGLVSEALEIWALIEAIEEENTMEKEEAEAQKTLEHQLENMQNQIDQLTEEVRRLKDD